MNFFCPRWTDLCPLCPLALSTRCPLVVQRKNKYRIYLRGEKIPELKIPELKIPELKIPELKIPELKIPELKIPELKIPELFRQLRNISVPELSYGTIIPRPIPLGGQPRPPSRMPPNSSTAPPSSLRGADFYV